MKLPNGSAAIVEDAKLTQYLLNPAHPVGGGKARLFKALLGIDLTNANVLKDALLRAARDGIYCVGAYERAAARI